MESQHFYIVADVRRLPLRVESLDGYISLGVVEHFKSSEDVLETLREAYTSLKPRSYAFLTIPNPQNLLKMVDRRLAIRKRTFSAYVHEYPLNPCILTNLSKKVGFSIVKSGFHDAWCLAYGMIKGMVRRDLQILKKAIRKTLECLHGKFLQNRLVAITSILSYKNRRALRLK